MTTKAELTDELAKLNAEFAVISAQIAPINAENVALKSLMGDLLVADNTRLRLELVNSGRQDGIIAKLRAENNRLKGRV